MQLGVFDGSRCWTYMCVLTVLVSMNKGNVLIVPVPTPPPEDGSVNQDYLGRITPDSDETHINQVLGSIGSEIIHGDIIADDETRRFIEQDPNSRNAIRYPHGLWPGNTVPYIIDKSIGSEGVRAIKDAIKDYHSQTCLKFVPRTTQRNYIKFTFGKGCSSSVGRTARGEQKINLHTYCWSKGIVIHEMAHAIGFFHEQSRSDRDSYVQVLFENIKQGTEENFKKFSQAEIQHLGEPYDYGSIMHYGPKAFTKNGRSTIVALKTGASRMGQRDRFSANDIRQINRLYKCSTKPIRPGPDASSVVYCSFDEGNLCEFVQEERGDDFDWTIKKGTTPTSGSGPSTDLSGRGFYIYIETSRPRVLNDKALLLSPLLTGAYCLRFHFHMLGINIGTLKVHKKDGETMSELLSVSGNQGDQWYRVEASTSDSKPFQIVFEGVRANGYRGDIALDEIKLTPGTCDGSTTPPPKTTPKSTTPMQTTTLQTTPKVSQANEVSCDFDSQSLCQFTQGTGDEFDWTLNKGSTQSGNTGPSKDASGTGYYVYAESSSPRQAGDRARLYSPLLTGDHCLKFFFHMYGNQMGNLHVIMLAGATATTVGSYSGNQGDQWYSVKGTVKSPQQYQLIFEAEVGQGFSSDIALDQISLTPGDCDQPSATTPPVPTVPQQADCNFDARTLCGFAQDRGDDFDWTLRKGPTPDGPNTGPSRDVSGNGYYIYAEASSPRVPGDRARFSLPFVTGSHCLHFRFNMHGSNMGTLRILGGLGSQEQQLWSNSAGDSGDTWQGLELAIETTARFQVIFEAVRGNGNLGDLALDEIRLTPGKCGSTAAQPPPPITLAPAVTTAVIPTPVSGGPCTPDWTKLGRSCYKAFSSRLPWSSANTNCQKYGGFLVSINNAREYNLVKEMASSISGDYAIWIGLRRDDSGKFSRWNDNREVTFTQWDTNQPDNLLQDQNCVEMFRWTGKWLDTSCNGSFAKKHPFICEIEEGGKLLECPQGWQLRNNACYKIYNRLRTWDEASTLCRLSKAELVSITSTNEQAMVRNLVKARSRGKYGFWIGLKRNYRGIFSWVDGSTLSFTEWLRGEPNNLIGNEDCTYMSSRAGYWLDSRCSRLLPFICKTPIYGNLPTQSPPTTPSLSASCGDRAKARLAPSGGNVSRIIGGKIAIPGAWPWQAAIMCKSCQSQDCGATLVSPYHVVTAAHCVPSNVDNFINNYKVRLGEYHFEKSEGNEQDIDIAAAYRHQLYGVNSDYDMDIAVLKLASPARFNNYVKPVCMSTRPADFPEDTPCYITGWGRTRQGGTVSSVLREATVPLISEEECIRNYRADVITSNMLCAGFRGGIDTCQGDSGGPLVCEKDNRWYLVGITSWGWGCAGQYYGVYTNVANVYDWIKARMV